MNLKKINLKLISIKYLLLFVIAVAVFYKAIFNSIAISMQTGSWRLFLIPFVFIIFREESKSRFQLKDSFLDLYICGLLVFIASLCQYLARWAGLNIFYEFSVILLIVSIMLLFTGVKGIYKYKWSLFYLLFMTSVTDEFILPLQSFLRVIATNVVTYLMPLLGFDVVHDGTNIRLSYIVMNVAAECSGINQLISLLVISIPLSIMILRKGIFRIVVIICSIPLAIFSNVFRLLIIGIWNFSRVEFSHGPHGLLAMSSIFLIGLILLCIFTLALSKIEGMFSKNNNEEKSIDVKNKGYINRSMKFLMTYYLFLAIFWFLFFLWRPVTNTNNEDILNIDNELAGWITVDDDILVFADTLLPNKFRKCIVLINKRSDKILIEVNSYPYQDSEKNLEITTYPVLRFLYDSKIQSINNDISYSFGYNSIDGKIDNIKATSVLYYVNKKIIGKRANLKIEIIKQLLLHKKNGGALVAVTLLNKGSYEVSERSVFDEVISELFR